MKLKSYGAWLIGVEALGLVAAFVGACSAVSDPDSSSGGAGGGLGETTASGPASHATTVASSSTTAATGSSSTTSSSAAMSSSSASGSGSSASSSAASASSASSSSSVSSSAASSSASGGVGPCANEGLVVQYYASDASNPDTTQITAHLQITNDTASAFQYKKLTLRYYYTDDDPNFPIDTFVCDSAAIGKAKITGAPVAMAMPAMNADHYIQIGFTQASGDLSAHGDSGDIKVRFYNATLHAINQLNDYSFSTANMQFADYGNITLYDNGCLVWGVEPQ